MLIPLEFSCSPALLTPGYGKKIEVFQTIRKKVVPRLESQKVFAISDNPSTWASPIGRNLTCEELQDKENISPEGQRSRFKKRPFSEGHLQHAEGRSPQALQSAVVPSSDHQVKATIQRIHICPPEQVAAWFDRQPQELSSASSPRSHLCTLHK